MHRISRPPRWEDIDPDDVDYEASDGLPTGHEHALRTLRSQIDSSKTLLRRYLRELGVSPGGDLVTVTVPTHLRYRDPFTFDRARKARSTQSTLESQRRRFCQLYAQHKRVKARLKNDADQECESEDKIQNSDNDSPAV